MIPLSPEFLRWFGASKVLDDRGRPLVVWHASPRHVDPFDVFDLDRVADLGFHFGTRRAASVFGQPRPFFLRIINPIQLEDPGDWFAAHGRTWSLQDQLAERGLIDRDQYDIVHSVASATHSLAKSEGRSRKWTEARAKLSRHVSKWLLAKGIDGVKYVNESEDMGSISWIVFDPRQIKSADNNRGTYDPEDPNIFHGVKR